MMSEDSFSWLTLDQIYTRRRRSGISSVELLALPDDLRQLMNQVLRREPIGVEALAEALGRSAEDVRGQLALLVAQGWLQTETQEGETLYRAHLKRRRARSLPPGIWQVLEGTWKVQLFRYFNDDEKADFTRAFRLEHFEAGEHLFGEGEWGYTMYLIDAGVVELVRRDVEGDETVLARLKPGDILGEVAVLLGERCWATARAVEPVSVWALHKRDLDQLLARSPSAGIAVRREIERRVQGMEEGAVTPSSKAGRPEQTNPLLVVGRGAMALAQALVGYTGERLAVIDLFPPGGEPQTSSVEGSNGDSVAHRSAHELDSKALAASVRQDMETFDRVVVAAPAELHGPVMGVISLIELVIDLSETEAPWVIAAARQRWTLSGRSRGRSRDADIAYLARRLCNRVVGLALSGGAARTLAHVGVLRALEEAQIPIDLIAGTGLGAVVAGLYAAGHSTDDLTDLATRHEQDLNPFDGSLSLRFVSRSALYAGKRARAALRKRLEGRTFADLRLPLYVVVADLESGRSIVIDQGRLSDAMEASLALAGLVIPAEITSSPIQALNGRLLVDGGLINPVPADVLRARGAGLVIGASTIPYLADSGELPSSGHTDLTGTWLRLRDQLAHRALMDNLRHLDVLIMPPVDGFDDTDFDRAAELIAAGLTTTQQEIDYVQRLLAPNT